jgi:hypothetical protein
MRGREIPTLGSAITIRSHQMRENAFLGVLLQHDHGPNDAFCDLAACAQERQQDHRQYFDGSWGHVEVFPGGAVMLACRTSGRFLPESPLVRFCLRHALAQSRPEL